MEEKPLSHTRETVKLEMGGAMVNVDVDVICIYYVGSNSIFIVCEEFAIGGHGALIVERGTVPDAAKLLFEKYRKLLH